MPALLLLHEGWATVGRWRGIVSCYGSLRLRSGVEITVSHPGCSLPSRMKCQYGLQARYGWARLGQMICQCGIPVPCSGLYRKATFISVHPMCLSYLRVTTYWYGFRSAHA